MSETVKRPKANSKKIHSKNEFELCYLRHQYIRKTDINPTEQEMKPFLPIVEHMAKNTFYVYKNLFHMVGFELEDVINIGRVHLVSFLGLFYLDKLPQKYQDFVDLYKKNNKELPNDSQMLDKNKANCTLFLKQRMEDVVRVCRQKARNIKGMPTEEYFYYYGSKKPPMVVKDLIKNAEKLGYKKLDQAIYRSIKKKNNIHELTFKFNNMYYIAIPVDQKMLSITDFVTAGIDPYENVHNMNPEELFFRMEDETVLKTRKDQFYSKSTNRKALVIKKFIQKHKKDANLIEEVRFARKILKT